MDRDTRNYPKLNLGPILETLGESDAKYLASGCFADVYAISNNRVLKITRDESDIQLSALVKENPHPNFVEIYEVTRISLSSATLQAMNLGYYHRYKNLAFMVSERLESLSESEMGDYIRIGTSDPFRALYYPRPLTKEQDSWHPLPPHEFEERFQWPQILGALLDLGVESFYDLHYRNIMKRVRDGVTTYVVSDLGCSQSSKPSPEVREISI